MEGGGGGGGNCALSDPPDETCRYMPPTHTTYPLLVVCTGDHSWAPVQSRTKMTFSEATICDAPDQCRSNTYVKMTKDN